MKKVYPFIEWRYRAYFISAALGIFFVIAMALQGGINLGIDFIGGTSVVIKFDRPVDNAMLTNLRSHLAPRGLGGNIRTIGGSGGSAEEARQISIDIRGSEWVNKMAEKFQNLQKQKPDLSFPELETEFAPALQSPRQLTRLKSFFVSAPSETTTAPLYRLSTITGAELTEVFQTIFNENIAQSVQEVLTEQLPPAGGTKDFDINSLRTAENLAAELAEIKRHDIAQRIATAMPDSGGPDHPASRPWKTVDQFIAAAGLEPFDGPDIRRLLYDDTSAGPGAVSVVTGSPDQLSEVFLERFTERFRRNAQIVITHRDHDFGGIFSSASQAGQFVPAEDTEMKALIEGHAHAGRFIIAALDTVGASVGSDMKWRALEAIMVSMLGIVGYIWWKFELRYSIGCIIALIHDTLLTIGLIGATGWEFSVPIVAAVLTVMGYSTYDTIVVYDRIREKLGKLKGSPDPAIIDLAITETLSRTVITSCCTMTSIFTFLILGPVVTRDLSFALAFGIFIGTFSSIFVAAPVLVEWDRFATWFNRRGGKKRPSVSMVRGDGKSR